MSLPKIFYKLKPQLPSVVYTPATKKQPDCGTCYQDAMKFIIKSKAGTLVHGAVTNTTGEVLGHAWVVFEDGEYVFEPQTGEVFKKKWFYDKFKAREIATYPAEKAMVNVLKYQSYGPWEDKAILPMTTKIPQDADGNDLVDLDGTPMELNKDGTLTLYHRTTPEAADQIRRTGNFKSLENTNETFFSNKLTGQAVGYGDAVVAVKIRPKHVRINDAFHDGEVHVAVSNRLLSGANIIVIPDDIDLRNDYDEKADAMRGLATVYRKGKTIQTWWKEENNSETWEAPDEQQTKNRFNAIMGREYAPETKADAEPIIRALEEAGFTPRLVGSIAKTGHSEHDIDIVLPFHLGSGTEEDGTLHEYWDDSEYRKFVDVMLRLGFRMPIATGEGIYAIKGGKGKPGTIHVDFFIENADEPEPFNEAEWMKEHGREYVPALSPKVSYTMTPGNPGAVYAYLDNRFIGSLLYTLSTGDAKIVNLNVSPLHLRQGVATGLYNTFEAEMLKKGVYRVVAFSVEPGVEPFWESVGFIRSGDDPRNWNKRISGFPDSLPATEEIIYQAYIAMPGSPVQYYQIVRVPGPKNTVQYKTMIKTEGGAWIGNIRATAAEALTLVPTNNKRLKVTRPLPARELQL